MAPSGFGGKRAAILFGVGAPQSPFTNADPVPNLK